MSPTLKCEFARVVRAHIRARRSLRDTDRDHKMRARRSTKHSRFPTLAASADESS
jgi:hypothetical protein